MIANGTWWGGRIAALTVASGWVIIPPMTEQAPPALFETLTVELGMSERDITRELNPTMGAVARAVGLQTTLHLIERTMGQRIYLTFSIKEGMGLFQPKYGFSYPEDIETVKKISDCFISHGHVELHNPFNARALLRLRGYKMIRERKSTNAIVSEIQCCRKTVDLWRRQSGVYGVGIRSDTPRSQNPKKEKVVASRQQGKLLVEIASEFDLPFSTVRRWCCEAGLETRDRQEHSSRSAVIELKRKGHSVPEISRKTGVSSKTVRRWCVQDYGHQ